MTRKLAFCLFLSIVASAAACSRPLLLIPGGALEGTPTRAPSDWSFTEEIDTIQLETNPGDPYSVNIWVAAVDEHLYVHAGANRATWVENIEADSRVRLLADGKLYELSASRVDEQSEFDRFSDAYEVKYGLRPRNENVTEAYLFRLAAR